MPDGLSRSQLVLYVAAGLAIAVLGVRYLTRTPSAAELTAVATAPAPGVTAPAAASSSGGAGVVVVHVAGAVRRPGVYRLREGARIDEAVRRAGGALKDGDLRAVNLAAKVQDGRQVLVPERAAARPSGGALAGAADGAAGAGGAAPGQPVNLNTATLEQLDTLPGVGPATAQKILDFREERGGFGSVEELGEVPGIGEKRLATLREAVGV